MRHDNARHSRPRHAGACATLKPGDFDFSDAHIELSNTFGETL